jgi:CheY-like chemotaxis protein
MRTLYVEDNEVNRFVFERILSPIIQVDLADTANKGIELAKENNYNFIVLDINLSSNELDGFDVLKAIKKYYLENNRHCYFYALTSYYGTDWEDKCISSGFDAYFAKPCNPLVILKYFQENLVNH